jgi:hypothetical protein
MRSGSIRFRLSNLVFIFPLFDRATRIRFVRGKRMDCEHLPAIKEIVPGLAIWSMIPQQKACLQETIHRLREVAHGYAKADAEQ